MVAIHHTQVVSQIVKESSPDPLHSVSRVLYWDFMTCNATYWFSYRFWSPAP
jgi:hypothetical protein